MPLGVTADAVLDGTIRSRDFNARVPLQRTHTVGTRHRTAHRTHLIPGLVLQLPFHSKTQPKKKKERRSVHHTPNNACGVAGPSDNTSPPVFSAALDILEGDAGLVLYTDFLMLDMRWACLFDTSPPPLYKLLPCPSYSRRRDRNNCVRNFDYVQDVVQPHKTWVCRHVCQLHGAMDTFVSLCPLQPSWL